MYATQTDIVTLYGEDALFVADRDRDGVPEADAITRALEAASAEIDTFLAARYQLPLAESHAVLVQYCVDIALYRLASSAGVMTEELRQRFEDALSALRRLADGKAALIIAPEEGEEDTGPRPITTGGPERLFSREKMQGL